MKLPESINFNTYLAYKTPYNLDPDRVFLSEDFDWDINHPKSLVVICIEKLSENWMGYPKLENFIAKDRELFLQILDTNVPLQILVDNIKNDIFWKRCYKSQWSDTPLITKEKRWINAFMEKYYANILENMNPRQYDPEKVTFLVKLCSPYIQTLSIRSLIPMDIPVQRTVSPEMAELVTSQEQAEVKPLKQAETLTRDHISLHAALGSLSYLVELAITFQLRVVGTEYRKDQFQFTNNDAKNLARGLEKCGQLKTLRITRSDMNCQRVKYILRGLSDGQKLETIDFSHCRVGDEGASSIAKFILRHENLKNLILVDNAFADSRNLPKLDNGALMEYIASNSNHNLAEIRGAKILMSSRDSYLDTAVGYVQLFREGGECHVKARVVPEHKVNSKPYTVVCKINEVDDVVIDSTCEDCAAAAGGCKHSLLLLFWLVKKSSEPASTSTECYWKKPSLSTARTTHILAKDIFPKAKKPSLAPKDPSILAYFYEECKKREIKNSLIIKYNTEMPRDVSMNIFDLTLTFVEKNVTHDFDNFKTFLSEIVDQKIINDINNKTKGQTYSKYWHNIRQGRLTASKLHEAAHCQTDGSLVEQILGGYKIPETKQIQRGKNLEGSVLEEISDKLSVNIHKSGFVLINGILGASPDGVAEDFVVEIKCPATEKAVRTYIMDGKIQNKFKAQVQCQMLACGKKKALFCVADPQFEVTKNIHLVWETYDACYINNIITLAERFWETYVFPKLIISALN